MNTQVVYIENGKTWTDSVKLANEFDKEHKDVLRKIEKQITEYSANFLLANFCADNRTVKIGEHGQERDFKYYRLTRDGFMAIAVTFTGKKAAAFREVVINQFNQMEQQLISVGIKTDSLSIAELLDLTSAELRKERAGRLMAEGNVVYLTDNAVTAARKNGYFSKDIIADYPQSVVLAREWANKHANATTYAEFHDSGVVTLYLKAHGIKAFDVVSKTTKGGGVHRYDRAVIIAFFKALGEV